MEVESLSEEEEEEVEVEVEEEEDKALRKSRPKNSKDLQTVL